MTKEFVLDTNVLLDDPECLDAFSGHTVVLPMVVLEEIDNHKKGRETLQQSARRFSRNLDAVLQKGRAEGGSLYEGVESNAGTIVRVVSADSGRPLLPDLNNTNDNLILRVAKALHDEALATKSGKEVILVTRDINLRIKADAVGIRSEDYKNSVVDTRDLYDTIGEVTVDDSTFFNELEEQGASFIGQDTDFYENEYILAGIEGQPATSLCRYYMGHLGSVKESEFSDVYSLKPRNTEQLAALDALLDPDIKCVVLTGPAGTGKTLITLAAGLQQVVNDGLYKKFVVTRPAVYTGGSKGPGWLPGTLDEKLYPWVKPFHDSMEKLSDGKSTRRRFKKGSKMVEIGNADNQAWDDLKDQGWIEVEAMSFVRGRNFESRFVVCDEAQNLTNLEAKTLVTRMGETSKVVFIGDPDQIDNPYVTKYSNGMAHIIQGMRGTELFAHIALEKSERSQLARLAAARL